MLTQCVELVNHCLTIDTRMLRKVGFCFDNCHTGSAMVKKDLDGGFSVEGPKC